MRTDTWCKSYAHVFDPKHKAYRQPSVPLWRRLSVGFVRLLRAREGFRLAARRPRRD